MSHWDAKICPYFEHFIIAARSGPTICHNKDDSFGKPYGGLTKRSDIVREKFGPKIKTCNHDERIAMGSHYTCPMMKERESHYQTSLLDPEAA